MGETKSNNRVLVTGAYGFLGKYIVLELLKHGYRVIAYGRSMKKLLNLRQSIADQLESEETTLDTSKLTSKLILYIGDFTNYRSIKKAVHGVNYVVHAGALSTVWGARDDFMETNVRGTINVIKACNASSDTVRRLIYISSPSIYCTNKDQFDIEESEAPSTNHLSYYIESKLRSESKFNHCTIPYTILRPRGLFGIGDSSIVPRIIKSNNTIGIPLFNGGTNKVDITCVENVAHAIRLSIESPNKKSETYNVTNGEPREFKKIVEQFMAGIEQKPKYLKINIKLMEKAATIIESVYRALHIYDTEPAITKYTIYTLGYSQTLNIDKIKDDIGYEPIISLDEGIKKYVEHWRLEHANK